jgi:hypothetical protein
VSELLSSLRALSDLTSFLLSGRGMDVMARKMLLDGLGAAVPQLRELHLNDFESLPSLTGLRTCTQLRTLELGNCLRPGGLPTADVMLLLPSLRHLERFGVYSCGLLFSDEQLAQLTPPSLLVPSLQQFECS